MCYVARVVMRNDIIFIIAYIRCITQYEIFIKKTEPISKIYITFEVSNYIWL